MAGTSNLKDEDNPAPIDGAIHQDLSKCPHDKTPDEEKPLKCRDDSDAGSNNKEEAASKEEQKKSYEEASKERSTTEEGSSSACKGRGRGGRGRENKDKDRDPDKVTNTNRPQDHRRRERNRAKDSAQPPKNGQKKPNPPPENRRAWCERCDRPTTVCVCAALPKAPLATRTRVVLLVHPKERQRKLGTAPLLKCSLQDIVLIYRETFPELEEDPKLHEFLSSDGYRPVLVCPGPTSLELEEAAEQGGGPSNAKLTLIFIDGSWRQAKAMVNQSPCLLKLPRVVLKPEECSGYTFRRQPMEGCLSTLEAVATALHTLEGHEQPTMKEQLVAPFRLMVDLQCAHIPRFQTQDHPLLNKEDPSTKASDVFPDDDNEPARPPPKYPPSWTRTDAARQA